MNIYLAIFTLIFLSLKIIICDNTNVCNGNLNNEYVFLSTLDGKVTALNIADGGRKAWELTTEPGALLSSSIDQIELSNHDHWTRMIPSLSGSLYKFDGETLDRIPFTVDSLLKSSFRYNDDVIISGGKVSQTYGIDMASGQLLYVCDMAQCNNITTDDLTSSDSCILVLQRQTQTVRSSEPHSGIERWNFSVGQHDLKIISGLNKCYQITNPSLKIDFKVNIPNGILSAYSYDDPEKTIWTHKSHSPIVNVWKFENGKIINLDIFKQDNSIDTLGPLVYLGMYKKQLYIQENERFLGINPSSLHLRSFFIEENSNNKYKIPWEPIPVSSHLISTESSAIQTVNDKNTAISVLYTSGFIDGNGYFLYGTKHPKKIADKEKTIEKENNSDLKSINKYGDEIEEMPVEIIIVSLWYWWKEVLFISVLTAILINILIPARLVRLITLLRNQKKNEINDIIKHINNTTECKDSGVDVTSVDFINKEPHMTLEFKSRYLQDFEPINCLGKGGFGIVFEARNKIDDCHYAIKRIPLPSQEESRNRVLREVKALAKLDHQNIVRYFNTWLEEPPTGWQEKHDSNWIEKSCDVDICISTRSDKAQKNQLNPGKQHMRSKSLSTMITFSQSSGKLSEILNNPKALVSNYDHSDSSFIVFDNETNENSIKECILDISSSNVIKNSNRRRYKSECDTKNNKNSERRAAARHYLYIQMQLCHQNSLREWLKDNTTNRNMNYILDIFRQIVQAVEYVHLQGLIHRDLKPSNIFFSLDGQIKIGDFGLVTEMIESDEGDSSYDGKKKKFNEQHTDLVGTQLYMSPEQLLGMSYNYKVDIYSLGVIFFELLNPFNTEMERYQTLTRLRNNVFPQEFSNKFKNEVIIGCHKEEEHM
ncbi:eukaryotic translation initiation factor 2-alpha kinase isoform X2 [Daktulosphaira vitifoliae]|uniref:eukaryotic translation initiation factor 2-alpha kinase isoform X2 n=1 Tax=Daktulosphaira vitifoliae TaxID=58002 RepID=UPI0021AA3906|nr:eukaryotic translation initiation factor 2-alpha kinase isoform X2 [Daktulosphaira vitifoliae]